MKNLSLGGIIKFLQKQPDDTYFNIPDDLLCKRSILTTRHDARAKIARIQLHYKLSGINTTFSVNESEMIKINIGNAFEFRTVIRITAENKVINPVPVQA